MPDPENIVINDSLPAVITGEKFYLTFPTCRIPPGTINKLARKEGLKPTGKGYNTIDLMNLVCDYIRRLGDKAKDHKERKNAADADISQLKAAQMEGDLLPKSEILPRWSDGIATLVRLVENTNYLSDVQKNRLKKTICETELYTADEEENAVTLDDPFFN